MDEPTDTTRTPLTPDRVLDAAVALADRDGLDALTMRALGADLGVRAMSIYRHVADKDAILDGMVEVVLAQISVPDPAVEWRDALRLRATSSRDVLARHSWAIGLIEGRGTMGPASLRQLDAVLGHLRDAGLGVEDAAHAVWLLDGFVYGHVLQAAGVAAQRPLGHDDRPAARSLAGATAQDHPHLVELGAHAAAHDFEVDRAFDVGLELVLVAVASLLRGPTT